MGGDSCPKSYFWCKRSPHIGPKKNIWGKEKSLDKGKISREAMTD